MLLPSFNYNNFRIVYDHFGAGVGNADVTIICPINTIIQPVSLITSLATDANVANRYFYLSIFDPIEEYAIMESRQAHTASLGLTYALQIGFSQPWTSSFATVHHMPMPDQILLEYGNSIVLSWHNKQAGDQLGGTSLCYKQWTVQQ